MPGQTFHVTKEDVRNAEAEQSAMHRGKVPADSSASKMKSMVDSASSNKSEEINQHKANLPLPEDPPPIDDPDPRVTTMGIGSGGVSEDMTSEGASSLRGPATAGSSVRMDGDFWKANTAPGPQVGRQGEEHLEGLPKDARY